MTVVDPVPDEPRTAAAIEILYDALDPERQAPDLAARLAADVLAAADAVDPHRQTPPGLEAARVEAATEAVRVAVIRTQIDRARDTGKAGVTLTPDGVEVDEWKPEEYRAIVEAAIAVTDPMRMHEAITAAAERIEALQALLDEILGTFTRKGSLGGVDDSVRSQWQDAKTVEAWRRRARGGV